MVAKAGIWKCAEQQRLVELLREPLAVRLMEVRAKREAGAVRLRRVWLWFPSSVCSVAHSSDSRRHSACGTSTPRVKPRAIM